MLSTMLLIARTDSESAKLISSSIDIQDHKYILGTTKGGKALADVLSEAEAKGVAGRELDALEGEWMKEHELCTFDQGDLFLALANPLAHRLSHAAVQMEIKTSKNIRSGTENQIYREYLEATAGKSNYEARQVANEILNRNTFWDWDRKPLSSGILLTSLISRCSSKDEGRVLSLRWWS
jgi:isocitrate lyase